MSKRKEEPTYDHTGAVDVEATREDRVEKPTQFSAPEKDQKWRARNVITIHWRLTGIECPYEQSYVHIMACVIDHANPTTGRCDASQRTMAIETGYHRNTVRKVLKWAADNTPFLKIENRGRRRFGQYKSNAYHVQWEALELWWTGIAADIQEQKEEARNGDVTPSPCTLPGVHRHAHSRGGTAMHTPGLCTKHKEETSKTEPHHETAHPPSAAGAIDNSQEEKGFQVVPPEEPVNPSEAEREAEAWFANLEKRLGRKIGGRHA